MNLTGRSLKQYQLIGQLGAGGMGVVYRARDTVLGRDVAVKVLPADKLQREESRYRFHREARAASALNHPNVVTIYEIGRADGIDFIAMEFVSGDTLHALLRQRRLSVAEASGYAYQVADALSKAHAAGVVHRDLKPGNLVITEDRLVKILDFGLARLNEAAREMHDDTPTNTLFTTGEGVVLGTIAYMSPEQARGEEAGPQSDIFSLGLVLFEMLSGQMPFSGTSELARLHSLNFATPKDLRALSPDVPEGLARVVSRMLEKDLGARYAQMTDVRRDLRPFAATALSDVGDAAVVRPELASANVGTVVNPAVWWRSRSGSRSLVRRRAARVSVGVAAVVLIASVVMGGRALWNRYATPDRTGPPATDAAIDPETAAPYDLYVRARQLLDRFDREGNAAAAIKLLERAVEKDSDFALGYATLTEAYRARYRLAPDEQWRKLMSQSARRALDLNPELGAAHVAMGLVLMEDRGKTAEAEREFRRAIDLDPKNPAPLLWLGALLSPAGRSDEAMASLQRALVIDPDNWVALLELGLIHYRAAQYDRAIAVWEQARQASPDNVRVLANLAAAYHLVDRYEDAASTLQRAIEIEPAARHYTNLGTLRFFQGRYEDAIPPFEKAVALTPNRYRYWGNLADAYRWSPGHKGKAPETFQTAIKLLREQLALKPSDPELRAMLALYLAKSGERAAALEQLRPLESESPPAAVLFYIAVAYEICAARDQALETLDRSLRAGYSEKEVRSDPELIELRNDVRYHKMAAARAAAAAR